MSLYKESERFKKIEERDSLMKKNRDKSPKLKSHKRESKN